MKTKIIPFDLEMAKKIQAGDIDGSIKTKNGLTCKIVSYCDGTDFFVERKTEAGYFRWCYPYTKDGRYIDGKNNGGTDYDLILEVPEKALEYEFKIGDKVVWAGIMGYITNINKNLVDIDPIICGIFHNVDISEIKLADNSATDETPKQKGELTLGKCKEGDEVWIFSNYEYGPKYVKVKVGKFSLDKSSGHRRNITFENGFTCQELISETCWKENPEEAPKNEFKPFDKVLVRNIGSVWQPKLYSKTCILDDGTYNNGYMTIDEKRYRYCIPYEGNEHLVGTTDKPKED